MAGGRGPRVPLPRALVRCARPPRRRHGPLLDRGGRLPRAARSRQPRAGGDRRGPWRDAARWGRARAGVRAWAALARGGRGSGARRARDGSASGDPVAVGRVARPLVRAVEPTGAAGSAAACSPSPGDAAPGGPAEVDPAPRRRLRPPDVRPCAAASAPFPGLGPAAARSDCAQTLGGASIARGTATAAVETELTGRACTRPQPHAALWFLLLPDTPCASPPSSPPGTRPRLSGRSSARCARGARSACWWWMADRAMERQPSPQRRAQR